MKTLLTAIAASGFVLQAWAANQPSPATNPPAVPAFSIPADSRLFRNDPAAGGIAISPPDGRIEPFASFSITFPSDMVSADKIDADGAVSPVVAWPPLDAKFTWRSPAEGDWLVTGPRIPGQTYRLRLQEGLCDLAGKSLPVGNWGVALSSDPLSVSCGYDERSQLSARPLVGLEFNYPVRLQDAADGLWFQDRATRRRFPAEVILGMSQTVESGALPAPTEMRVSPRDPLPVGAFYDLVVENVCDAYAGRTLPYPRVFPIGTTRPLVVDFVAARNWATDKPHIEIKFRTFLSDAALPADAVVVDPPVPGQSLRVDGESVLVDGKFDTSVHYRVTVSNRITGDRGFALAAPSVWGATFSPKPPTVLFPPGEFRQRSALGLRFALVQCNAGPLTWRLAAVPPAKLAAVTEKVKDPGADGGKLLVDEFALPVAGSGSFPSVGGDREELRRIEFQPPSPLAGPYLLEAVAGTDAGPRVANRSLVWFGETALTQKLSPDSLTVRAASMGSGQPLPDLTVRLFTKELLEIAAAKTDSSGNVSFPRSAAQAAAFFQTESGGVNSLWPATADGQFGSGSLYQSASPAFPGRILTDRPLYRPGQELKIHGLVRERAKSGLRVPAGESINWQITKAWQSDVIASGTATVTPAGGWNAEWTAPAGGDLGDFRVSAKVGAAEAGEDALFRIEEFRNPPFSVVCERAAPDRPGESVIKVASQYFHGAPNAGARVKWKATWFSDHSGDFYNREDNGGFTQIDLYSENVKAPVFDVVKEGETALDGQGRATLSCAAPFPDPGNRAHANVIWQVDVTGPDGQTITDGAMEAVTMNDTTLGVKVVDENKPGPIHFELRAVPRVAGAPLPPTVRASLFLVRAKSVKEQIAPFVYRYRNFNEFARVAERDIASNGRADFDPKDPGRYVLVVSAPGTIPVSEEAIVAGPGESQFPVRSDERLEVVPVAESSLVGDTAAFNVIAPSPGIAWVTVETDRVLYSETVKIPGNATRIRIPVRPEFLPNAFVSVYLLRPGGGKDLPGEMFGFAPFRATDPSRDLALRPATAKTDYEPRETVRGSVTVTNAGKPVAAAEVTVYAVDDSILELGGWKLPAFEGNFFPENTFSVVTYPALRGLVSGFAPESLAQKGYIVGGGGDEEFGKAKFTRTNFKPLVFWCPALLTDADGRVAFECQAPDNLTRFRVIALAQTAASQFGAASETFTVSKNLLIEPALPRFLRVGDEIDLRAVTRQRIAETEPLAVRCTTGLDLQSTDSMDVRAAKNAPAVVRFAAKVPAGISDAKVRFDVVSQRDKSVSDSVEITIPVLPRTITVNESKAGTWAGNDFPVTENMPPAWDGASGTFDLTLSTSPWLTKLMGIPSVLDYPHGCLEQKSSRILVYTAMADLLKWLPADSKRDEIYRGTILESLKEFEASLLPDGLLPYWPMGTTGNAFVTIQCARAVALAQEAGMDVPPRLAEGLPVTLNKIVARSIVTSPTLRAFALATLAGIEPGPKLVAAANEIYLERDKLTNDGRAILALALNSLNSAPDKQLALVRSLPKSFEDRMFDPVTFSSSTRTATLCLLARFVVDPGADSGAIRARLEKMMESPQSLSTQENLWLLLAARALIKSQPTPPIAKSAAPKPDAVSPNKSAAEWSGRLLAKAGGMAIGGLGQSAKGSYVLAAHRALSPDETSPVQNGIRLDRIVRNLTDPARTGSPESPFRLGDEILISYRFQLAQAQSFLALEDALPAGLEVINPNLALFGKLYAPDQAAGAAMLSHSQMHDSRTDLYFDSVDPGLSSYAVLARATAAGSFAWPAAQISPMYDSRFNARTAPSTCSVVAP